MTKSQTHTLEWLGALGLAGFMAWTYYKVVEAQASADNAASLAVYNARNAQPAQ